MSQRLGLSLLRTIYPPGLFKADFIHRSFGWVLNSDVFLPQESICSQKSCLCGACRQPDSKSHNEKICGYAMRQAILGFNMILLIKPVRLCKLGKFWLWQSILCVLFNFNPQDVLRRSILHDNKICPPHLPNLQFHLITYALCA